MAIPKVVNNPAQLTELLRRKRHKQPMWLMSFMLDQLRQHRSFSAVDRALKVEPYSTKYFFDSNNMASYDARLKAGIHPGARRTQFSRMQCIDGFRNVVMQGKEALIDYLKPLYDQGFSTKDIEEWNDLRPRMLSRTLRNFGISVSYIRKLNKLEDIELGAI